MKALFVVAPKDFRDEEYFEPKKVLEENGVEVVTACRERQAVSANGGKKINAGVLLDEAKASDYDAVVFIGGRGAQVYFDDATAHCLARQVFEEGKVVAAICIAPAILANAGVMKGRKATCFPSVKEALETKGARYTATGVEVDGKIITANGPQSATEFGKRIAAALKW